MAEFLNIAQHFAPCVPAAILFQQNVGHALPALGRDTYVSSLISEFVQRKRKGGIEGVELWITAQKIEKEPRDTGHITEGKTFLVQSGLSRSSSYYSPLWISAECRRMQNLGEGRQ